jgi:hypothetical protein
MLVIRTTVRPDVLPHPGGGGFTPTSFDHLMGHDVHVPGLDNIGWSHTLIDARVTDDGSSAELTYHCTPKGVGPLDHGVRVVSWQPPAYVRAHDTDGGVLAEVRRDAPLQVGEQVELGGVFYRVAPAEHHHMWPHRDPATGVCKGTIDWQHVTLTPEDRPAHLPQLARAPQ